MSDIYLQSSNGIADMVIINGLPQLTDGLDNAVYLSLFMLDYWGNSISEEDEKYNTEIPKIMAEQNLTNQTRLDIIEAGKKSLAWMVEKGIASNIDVVAEIPSIGRLNLAVTIKELGQDVNFAYGLNWDAQEIFIQGQEKETPKYIPTATADTYISETGEIFISETGEEFRSDSYLV